MGDKTSEAAKAMPKTVVYKELASKTGLEAKQIAAVMEALEELIVGELGKEGAREFVLPNLIKLKKVIKPASPGGTKSVAGRMVEVKPKPASVKVKTVILKGLKEIDVGGEDSDE